MNIEAQASSVMVAATSEGTSIGKEMRTAKSSMKDAQLQIRLVSRQHAHMHRLRCHS